MSSTDHFTAVAQQYVQSRPSYPPELFCEPFYAEVRRVLKPGGLVAARTYGVLHVDGEAVEQRISHFYHRVVGPYWPAGRRHLENGYAELPFPFEAVASPALAIHLDWSLDELLGYCRNWSATAYCQRATGSDPVIALEAELAPVWGPRAPRRRVTLPIVIRAGRC